MRFWRNRRSAAKRPDAEDYREGRTSDDGGAGRVAEPTAPAQPRAARPAGPAAPPAERPATDEATATDEPAATEERTAPAPRRRWGRREPAPGVPGARKHIPASRGMLVGTLLVLLGLWGALIPLVGPYFNYEFGSDSTWDVTWQRVWLDILPGAALVLGGLILIGAKTRPAGVVGAWLALAGGIWFAVGPPVSMLWHGTQSVYAPIGQPLNGKNVQFLELLGYFYGLGALATALAGFALGRLSIVGVRDVEVAAARTGATAPASRT
jgi:hypothetical protein